MSFNFRSLAVCAGLCLALSMLAACADMPKDGGPDNPLAGVRTIAIEPIKLGKPFITTIDQKLGIAALEVLGGPFAAAAVMEEIAIAKPSPEAVQMTVEMQTHDIDLSAIAEQHLRSAFSSQSRFQLTNAGSDADAKMTIAVVQYGLGAGRSGKLAAGLYYEVDIIDKHGKLVYTNKLFDHSASTEYTQDEFVQDAEHLREVFDEAAGNIAAQLENSVVEFSMDILARAPNPHVTIETDNPDDDARAAR